LSKRKKKKKKIKVGTLFISLLLIIIIGLLIHFILVKIDDSKELPQGPIIAKEKKPQEYKLSLVMVGDALIHESIYKEANKNANYNGYDFKPMISLIKDYIKKNKYDLAYYNQETIIGGSDIGLSTYPAFNSPDEIGDAMIDAGFNMVSLATNHTLDRGIKAIEHSCNYWNSKKEVLSAGSYCSEEQRNTEKIFKKNNITYTMLNYTYGTNGIPIPDNKNYLVNIWPTEGYDPDSDTNYQEYKKEVLKDIEKVRDKVDVLIVAMHWGVEYTHTPTSYQKDMAKFLADNNVDIVIGTHPHVVEPIEYIDDTLVIYSLGNFISAQDNDINYAKLVGLLTSIDIIKTVNKDETTIKLDNLNNDLLFTYYESKHNFKVVPFSIINSDYLSNYESLYDTYSTVVKNLDNTIPVMGVN